MHSPLPDNWTNHSWDSGLDPSKCKQLGPIFNPDTSKLREYGFRPTTDGGWALPQSDDELGYFLSDNEYADMKQDSKGYSAADEDIIDQYKRLDETISSDEINEILNRNISNIPIAVL